MLASDFEVVYIDETSVDDRRFTPGKAAVLQTVRRKSAAFVGGGWNGHQNDFVQRNPVS